MERSKAKKEREEEMVFIGMVGHHTVPVDHYVLQSIIKHAESIPFTLYSMCATIGDKKQNKEQELLSLRRCRSSYRIIISSRFVMAPPIRSSEAPYKVQCRA